MKFCEKYTDINYIKSDDCRKTITQKTLGMQDAGDAWGRGGRVGMRSRTFLKESSRALKELYQGIF
jgi:hypothetical protein